MKVLAWMLLILQFFYLGFGILFARNIVDLQANIIMRGIVISLVVPLCGRTLEWW